MSLDKIQKRAANSTLQISDAIRQECFDSGYKMADLETFQCPAMCKVTMGHIAALCEDRKALTVAEISQLSSDGDYRSVQMMEAWREGYKKRNDEICNAILREDMPDLPSLQ